MLGSASRGIVALCSLAFYGHWYPVSAHWYQQRVSLYLRSHPVSTAVQGYGNNYVVKYHFMIKHFLPRPSALLMVITCGKYPFLEHKL